MNEEEIDDINSDLTAIAEWSQATMKAIREERWTEGLVCQKEMIKRMQGMKMIGPYTVQS